MLPFALPCLFAVVALGSVGPATVVNYDASPATRTNYVSNGAPASTQVVVVGEFAVVGTYDGKLLFHNLTGTTSIITNQVPDTMAQVSTSPVTGLWMQSATTVGFIANTTVGVYTVATGAVVWTHTVQGTLDIRMQNEYWYGQGSPFAFENGMFFLGSQNWTYTMNSTIYAFNSAGLVWSTSVMGAWSNYWLGGNETEKLLIARTSALTSSWLIGLNATTGELLSFMVGGNSWYGYAYNTPTFTYTMGRVYAIVSNGYFQSFAVNDSTSTSMSSLSCGGSSNMAAFDFNNTIFAVCSSYIYAYGLSNGASNNYMGYDSVSYGDISAMTYDEDDVWLVGTSYGRVYTYSSANFTFATNPFFTLSGTLYSGSVLDLSWNVTDNEDWTVLVSIGTVSTYTGGYSSTQGRIFFVNYDTGMVPFFYGDYTNPIGPPVGYESAMGYSFAVASNFENYNTYRVVTAFLGLAPPKMQWAMHTYNSAETGAIFLNATVGLIITVDNYGYLYGWNMTTGVQLFRSAYNCDITASEGFVWAGDNVVFLNGDYVKTFNWKTAMGTSVVQSCTSNYQSGYVYGRLVAGMGVAFIATTDGTAQINPSTGATTQTFGTSAYKTPAVSMNMVFTADYYTLAAYNPMATTAATAVWKITTLTSPTTNPYYGISFMSNVVVMGTNVYVVGTTPATVANPSGGSVFNTLYCFTQLLGLSCGKSRLMQSDGNLLIASENGALYVFGTYNMSAVAPLGGGLYWSGNVSTSSAINTAAYALPTISSNGFLGLSTLTGGIYAFNAYTGDLLWTYTVAGGSQVECPVQYTNNMLYWCSSTAVIASNPFNGDRIAVWSQATGSDFYGYVVGPAGWVFGIQNEIVFSAYVPTYANVTGSLPATFGPASGGDDGSASKPKLWIIAVVIGIIVVAVIVLFATRKSGATSQKDTDYVSMQGTRV